MSTILFPDATRATLEALDRGYCVTELQSCFEKFSNWQVPEVKFGNPDKISESQRARNNLEILCQGLLHRSLSLLQAFPTMVENANVYGMALLCRGHFESTSQLGYFCDRLTALKKGNITFDAFHDHLYYALMGSAHPLFKRAPKPINIMTFIDKAERHFSRKHNHGNTDVITDSYNWLSEYCHPNFLSSRSSYYLNVEKNTFEFRCESPLNKQDGVIIGYFSLSCKLFELFYDDINGLKDVIAD